MRAVLTPVRPPQCDPAETQGRCDDFDAIVVVHGIGGDETTFTKNGFDWPAAMPETIVAAGKSTAIDVYMLNYSSTVARWTSGTNASARIPSPRMTSRSPASSSESATSGITIGAGSSVSGLHGLCPSTAAR